MRKTFQSGLPGRAGGTALVAALLLCAAHARAQGSCTFTDESGKTFTWPNCQDPNAAKYAADKPAADKPAAKPAGAPPAANVFAFPGEPAPAPAAPPASSPGSTSGDTKAAPPGGLTDAGSSGSSSSSSSSSSSAGGVPFDDPPSGPLAGDDDDAAAKAAAKRKAERKRLFGPKEPTGEDREAEDLRVAAFYQNDNNFRGAYMRAMDAVSLDADDPEAHFALAEAARKLGKLDEALTNYKKCLTLDPVPKTKKAADKAVKVLEGSARNTLMP